MFSGLSLLILLIWSNALIILILLLHTISMLFEGRRTSTLSLFNFDAVRLLSIEVP